METKFIVIINLIIIFASTFLIYNNEDDTKKRLKKVIGLLLISASIFSTAFYIARTTPFNSKDYEVIVTQVDTTHIYKFIEK